MATRFEHNISGVFRSVPGPPTAIAPSALCKSSGSLTRIVFCSVPVNLLNFEVNSFSLFERSHCSSRLTSYCSLRLQVLHEKVMMSTVRAYGRMCVFGRIGMGMTCMNSLKREEDGTEPCGTTFVYFLVVKIFLQYLPGRHQTRLIIDAFHQAKNSKLWPGHRVASTIPTSGQTSGILLKPRIRSLPRLPPSFLSSFFLS